MACAVRFSKTDSPFSFNGSEIHTTSLACDTGPIDPSVRTKENHWGNLEPVVVSTNCSTVLASSKSSNPLDWLEMCRENHDIYRNYMTPATKNHLKDLVPSIFKEKNAPIQIENTTTQASTKKSLLFIGDSLDRFMAYHVCNITKGIVQNVDPDQRPFVCSSPTLELGFFNIFGMYKTCSNGGLADKQDSRHFNFTADRLQALLPEVLDRMDSKPQYVQISSALWDLSEGCVGQNGVPDAYQDDYSLGMRQIYNYLTSEKDLLDENALIYWRTSPPMRKSYSAKWVRLGWIPFSPGSHGRTRRNQLILNQVLKDTFFDFDLGHGIVDWWQLVQSVSERFLDEELPDGRHYSFCSCMAFFNDWLDQVSMVESPFLVR